MDTTWTVAVLFGVLLLCNAMHWWTTKRGPFMHAPSYSDPGAMVWYSSMVVLVTALLGACVGWLDVSTNALIMLSVCALHQLWAILHRRALALRAS